MPQNAWSDKRERQYKHIKESEKEQGRSDEKAEQIAAATVNKQRAEHGETKAQRAKK
jgi:plasmid stabilization system protein ParE